MVWFMIIISIACWESTYHTRKSFTIMIMDMGVNMGINMGHDT